MQKILTVILLTTIGSACTESHDKPDIIVEKISPNFTNLKIEGSLTSNTPLSCAALDKVGNMITPPDMFAGLAKCVEREEFEKAGNLLHMAYLYGAFDSKRVADKTAGQGITVLLMNTFSSIDNNKATQFQEYLKKPNTKNTILSAICDHAKKIGRPAYHPKYMIYHGVTAFTGIKGNGLDPDFDDSNTWQSMIDINCQTPN